MPEQFPYEIKIIRSRRRSLSVEVHSDCSIIVRAPNRVSKKEIDDFVDEHRDWMDKKLAEMSRRIQDNPVSDKYSERELERLTKEAREELPSLVAKYAERMGIPYGRITVRCQKTLWGSCTAKGNLSFNCLLMLLPEPVREYVIVHELCHIKELNHSPAFWQEVERYCPDYRYLRDFLKNNGEKLMLRL